jgi:hypothetical protein
MAKTQSDKHMAGKLLPRYPGMFRNLTQNTGTFGAMPQLVPKIMRPATCPQFL